MKEFKLKDPLLSQAEYEQMYQQSFADKEGFWSKIANEQLTWFKNFSQVKNTSFEGDVRICSLYPFISQIVRTPTTIEVHVMLCRNCVV